MTPRIFISYRRHDSAMAAGRIYERLEKEFGSDNLFRDVDTVRLGEDFIEKLRDKVAACDILLAIIGPNWLHEQDDKEQRRLDDPDDLVRVELVAALNRGIRVIPVLIEDTPFPKAEELPGDLAGLATRQGLHLRDESFEANFATLLGELTPPRSAPATRVEMPILSDLSYPLAAFGLAILFLICSYTGVLPPQEVLREQLQILLHSFSAAWLLAISAIESTVAFNVYFPGALVILWTMAETAGQPSLTLRVFAFITSGQLIGYLADYCIGYYFGRSIGTTPRSLQFESRYLKIDWPVPPWALILSTFCHPHSAALTSYNLGTQAFSPVIFVGWSVLGTLIWGMFWTFVCLSGANVFIKQTPWGLVFLLYVVIWLLWIFVRRRRARKPAIALGQ